MSLTEKNIREKEFHNKFHSEKKTRFENIFYKALFNLFDDFYDYLKKDKKFADEVKDIENIALDFAESQLHKQIQEGNTSATIFYLKTKGKSRNYVERQEIQHNGTVESTLIEWKPSKSKK